MEGFNWKYSVNQQARWFGGLVVFAAVYPASTRLFIIPSDVPELRYDNHGKQRNHIYVDLAVNAQRRRNYDPAMAILFCKYENAFHLIEEYRIKASEALMTELQPGSGQAKG